jgi:glycosyltransferase involved in cell wall biosynthesis
MCKDLGHEALLLVDKKYGNHLGLSGECVTASFSVASKFQPDAVLCYSSSYRNLFARIFFRKKGGRLLFVLHEPFPGLREFVKEPDVMARYSARMLADALTCKMFDAVLLPSRVALEYYRRSTGFLNRAASVFPLIYADEYQSPQPAGRIWLSLIGGFSDGHGSGRFISLVKHSVAHGLGIKFLIATRDDISARLRDPGVVKAIEGGWLAVRHGRPLSSVEINECYRASICVWLGYKRSTQSGVMANAFMMGAPVLASSAGSFGEYVEDGKNGFILSDFDDHQAVVDAFMKISNSLEAFEENARRTFVERFHYARHSEAFRKLLECGSLAEPSDRIADRVPES